jgi:Cysteine-rich secretory protein family
MRKFPWSAPLIGAGIIVASILTTVPSDDAESKVDLSGIRRISRSPYFAMLYHNDKREQHCVPSASYSRDLAREAQDWANQCTFSHSHVANRGENLYWGTARTSADTWTAAVNWWYNEIQYYDFNNPGFSTTTGHFTQVIWRGTTQIGCGRAVCPYMGGLFGYWVCRYYPPGNYFGQFPANVPPRCK